MDIISGDKSGQPLFTGLYEELQKDILSGSIPTAASLQRTLYAKNITSAERL